MRKKKEFYGEGYYHVHKELEYFTVNEVTFSHWCFLFYNNLKDWLLNVLFIVE